MRVISLALLMFVFYSCKRECNVEPFVNKKQLNNSSSIRLDGYYYQKQQGSLYNVEFYYKDGTFMYCSDNFNDGLTEINQKIANGYVYETVKNSRLSWGGYVVSEQTFDTIVTTELWLPRAHCGFRRVSSETIVLNDTTMVLKNSPLDTLYFYTFDIKPDSTNDFIK